MKRSIFAIGLALLAMNVLAGHHEKNEMDAAPATEAAVMAAMAAAATPGDAHAKLADSEGSFKASMAFYMEPDGEPMVSEMTVERKMDLEGRVLVEYWKGQMMGAPFEGRARTGFDNVTQKFWSTWTDNMSTGLLVMYGEWDAAEKAMVFSGKGINPITGQEYVTRSVGRFPEPGKETMTMYEDHGNGEYKSMTISLVRQ